MAPSPSAEPLSDADGARLLDIADAAIVDGLRHRVPVAPDLDALPPALREPAAVFVTLEVGDQLNGCIGTISADEPLAVATARHARAAAFGDPRLPVLRPEDHADLSIEVSVLSALEPVAAGSRDELLSALRPGVDGLILAGAGWRAVFLPKVWQRLPHPDEFVGHLLLKAGIPPAWWPPDTEAARFTVQEWRRAATTRPPTRPG
jgi:AmmeMemoRadiSam system protein A